MAIKKFKVNASKQAKSIKKRIIASELLSGIDKLPERGKVITKTIKGDPVVIVGIGDNKYMYKSYLNKASATGDVQFIRNLIKKGEVPANAVKNLGYKLYTSSGSVESACGKKSVKASSSLKVKPYVINKGQSGEYYGLKNAEDNQVLHSAPNNWKSERGAINWAKKKGYEVVDSSCGKKSVKSSKSVKKFGVKASKSAKKRVAAAKGYWADDINAENYRKILQALDDYLIANYDGKTIGGVEIGVSKLRSVKNGIGSKIEIMFYCPDYNKETKLEIITAPELRSKFLGRVSATPFKFDDEFMIRQSGCKQVVVDKINEIADMLSNGSIEGVCGKKRTVKASHSAKKRKAIKASGIQNDIVMYFNGDNVYQGSVYDLADAVENLCYDDEVNAKFQEWCNQFGDPFDFDGSPIDTARVFTDIIIHEAEESPVSEDGQSEFYEDGNGILDFEIFYADEFSIDGAKSIKCWDNGNDVWEYQESYDNYYDEEPPEHIGKELERLAKLTDKYMNMWFDKFEELHPNERYSNVYDFPDVDEAVGFTRDAAEYYPDQIEISASKSIKCDKSLNLNAKPNYTDWVLRGYKFDGEDVTTLRIDFQDDVKKAVMDMFSDPDVETVDLYKIPTEQETTGVFEDEEYFSTITRDDINASTDITAALNKKSDINDEQYNQALADEVADMLRADGFEDIEVSVAPEAISFFINDEVMFVQPTNMITPNMADIYDDCTELFNAVKEATTDKMWKLYDEENKAMRDAWEDPDIEDPDYATRAVTLSRKAKGKDISAAEETIDIDDLEYITGDASAEDRIFDVIIDKLRTSELAEFGEVDILSGDADIKVYPDGADIDYIIAFIADPITINFEDRFMEYEKYPDYNTLNHTQHINGLTTEIIVHNGTIGAVNYVDLDDYDLSNYDIPAYEKYVERLARPVVEEIYNFVDQAVHDGNITSSTAVTADGDYKSDDWGFGFDSNDEPVTESMVEELEHIAQRIVYRSEIAKVDEHASVEYFNYYASIPYIQESFIIDFTYSILGEELARKYAAEDAWITTTATYDVVFNVRCENGEVKDVEIMDVNADYIGDAYRKNVNERKLIEFAKNLVAPVAEEIYNQTTNI